MPEEAKYSSRRDFLKLAGSFTAGAIVACAAVSATQPVKGPVLTETATVAETKPVVTGGDINAFRAALERDGFFVQEGEFSYQDAIALLNAGVLKTAGGPMSLGQT